MPTPVTVSTTTGTPDITKLLGSTTSSTKKSSNGFDKDMFMALLVAQLKNQNPLEPADSSQFMQQAATLAQVEQMTQMTTATSNTASWQRSLAGAALLGKTVTGQDKAGITHTGVVEKVSLSSNSVSLTVDGASIDLTTVTTVK